MTIYAVKSFSEVYEQSSHEYGSFKQDSHYGSSKVAYRSYNAASCFEVKKIIHKAPI